MTECRGCGRAVDISGLRPKRRFYCRACGQMMRTTRKQAAFRFTPEYVRSRRRLQLLLFVLLLVFPVWAVDRMTHHSPLWAGSKWGLMAAAWAVGLAAAAAYRWLRPLSNDVQYWSGVLLVVTSLERFALDGMGEWLGASFLLARPWFGLVNGFVMLACLPIAHRIWPSV